jgi:2-dehydropantoate 2-reductase
VGQIAVLGPGGVGGFLAAALTHAGEDVILVARPSTAVLIARDGLAVRSVRLGDFISRPEVATELRAPADVLILATKATTLKPALDRVKQVPPLVVPLLNGLDHMGPLRERFGADRVVAGSIRIESDRPAPGQVVQTSPSVRVDLATDDPSLKPRLEALAKRLEQAGVPVRIECSEAQALWSKLVRLNALACTTAASDRPLGFIRTNPEWRAALQGCIYEAATVAHAEGAEIDPSVGLTELDEAHPSLGSSMQRDIAAGREPELDAIPGAVLRAAARHGIECPTVARLTMQIAHRAATAPPQV